MKKSWILFTLSSCFLSAQVQFHPIAYSKPLYKVEEITEHTETKSLPESGEADNPISQPPTPTAGKHSEEMRSQWINYYMSVSYSLQDTTVRAAEAYGGFVLFHLTMCGKLFSAIPLSNVTSILLSKFRPIKELLSDI